MRDRYNLNQSALYKVNSKKRLAAILQTSVLALKGMSKKADASYRRWEEPKSNGTMRQIEDPYPPLKKLHRRISWLLSGIEPPDFLMCPVKGRSYLTNATTHKDATFTITLDIQNYFASTTSRRIYWFFHSVMLCSEDVAGLLARICTVDGHLPTGSPVSPILAYYAHSDMWQDVNELAIQAGWKQTTYMDDLTVSGQKRSHGLEWQIRKRIYRSGLKLNESKTRRYYRGVAEVTGAIVGHGKLRVPKRGHKKLQQTMMTLNDDVPPEERDRIKRSLRSIKVQHRQILKIS